MSSGSLFFLLLAVNSWPGTFGGVTATTKYIEVDTGGSATLSCDYTPDFENARVEWLVQKDDQIWFVYALETVSAIFKDRVSYFLKDYFNDLNEIAISTTMLFLNDLTPDDSGTYSCEISKISEPTLFARDTIELHVREPVPQIPDSYCPKNWRQPFTERSGTMQAISCHLW